MQPLPRTNQHAPAHVFYIRKGPSTTVDRHSLQEVGEGLPLRCFFSKEQSMHGSAPALSFQLELWGQTQGPLLLQLLFYHLV